MQKRKTQVQLIPPNNTTPHNNIHPIIQLISLNYYADPGLKSSLNKKKGSLNRYFI